MFQYQTYPVAVVHQAMEGVEPRARAVLPDGHTFRPTSHRMMLFKTKGTVCVTCGLEGTVYVLEAHALGVTPHLNLYGVNEQGEYVILTKDHIIPKSKGGRNALENYNTMCGPCNWDKGNRYEEELASVG